jgi:uncharacterized membrane protein YoaK (UPF0700 family)
MEASRARSASLTNRQKRESERDTPSAVMLEDGNEAGERRKEAGKDSHHDQGDEEDATSSKATEVDEDRRRSMFKRLKERASETISPEDATVPFAWQALLTGLIDGLLYSRSMVWTGFQTGNLVQTTQGITSLFYKTGDKEPLLVLLRSLSVISFFIGSFIGARVGARWGEKTRGWQTFSAFIQAISLFGAFALLMTRPDDAAIDYQHWPGVIVMTAFSMGLQSISAQKMVSGAFATVCDGCICLCISELGTNNNTRPVQTIAFTASLTQISSDPWLFALSFAPIDMYREKKASKKCRQDNLEADAPPPSSPPKAPRTLGRDQRIFALFALCFGAAISEYLLHSPAGCRGGLAVSGGFKLILAVSKDGKPWSPLSLMFT